MNAGTGKFSNMLLNMGGKDLPLYEKYTYKLAGPSSNKTTLPLLNTGVAAIAYDQKTNRLFYVPMNDDQLRYIDLSNMKVHENLNLSFSQAASNTFKNTSPVTRLVIAPDGYGYTVTTDGNHLVRFSTNNNPVLTNLGELSDDPHNREMTINNPCANAGGDMVADDAGNLYLITAANRVFKIDITTRITTYLATITGLPPQFTTNGAAVAENGDLLISSSVYTAASYIVDSKKWKVIHPAEEQQHFGIADLASGFVLRTKEKPSSVILFGKALTKTGNIRIYPNPVLFDEVHIQFNDLPTGKYIIELADPLSRKVIRQKVFITSQTQTTLMQIPTITAQAFYYIRILNDKNILVSTHKLAVERW
jgi:DNA-binding beta-propeller fold protein YncE